MTASLTTVTTMAMTIATLFLEHIECTIDISCIPLLNNLSFVDLLISVPLFTKGLYFFIALCQLDN
jgi:hypothetical protein